MLIKKFVLIALVFGLCGCAGSFSKLTKTDIQYQAAGTVATLADWNQTLQFEKNGHSEQNIFLGKYPSKEKINTLIPLAIAGQWLFSWFLPSEARFFKLKYNPRRVFQVGIISGELWAVNHNYQVGIKVNF